VRVRVLIGDRSFEGALEPAKAGGSPRLEGTIDAAIDRPEPSWLSRMLFGDAKPIDAEVVLTGRCAREGEHEIELRVEIVGGEGGGLRCPATITIVPRELPPGDADFVPKRAVWHELSLGKSGLEIGGNTLPERAWAKKGGAGIASALRALRAHPEDGLALSLTVEGALEYAKLYAAGRALGGHDAIRDRVYLSRAHRGLARRSVGVVPPDEAQDFAQQLLVRPRSLEVVRVNELGGGELERRTVGDRAALAEAMRAILGYYRGLERGRVSPCLIVRAPGATPCARVLEVAHDACESLYHAQPEPAATVLFGTPLG
jgi:hypothetical protein